MLDPNSTAFKDGKEEKQVKSAKKNKKSKQKKKKAEDKQSDRGVIMEKPESADTEGIDPSIAFEPVVMEASSDEKAEISEASSGEEEIGGMIDINALFEPKAASDESTDERTFCQFWGFWSL